MYSHAAFASAIGGVRYPILADFHPKGAVARSFGLFLEGGGITDRATVLIDANGEIIRIESVTPAGKRDFDDWLASARALDSGFSGLPEFASPAGIEGATLYVRDGCMFSRWALYNLANVGLKDTTVKNVSQDPEALAELQAAGGKGQAPALRVGDRVMYESADIGRYFVEQGGQAF